MQSVLADNDALGTLPVCQVPFASCSPPSHCQDCFKAGKEARLIARNQIDFGNYPQLIDALKLLTAENVVIDGEIAALDSEGKTSFQLLQSYGISKQIPLVYYAFDLLNLEETDLRSRPLVERRKLLAKLLKEAPDNIRFSEELAGYERRTSPARATVWARRLDRKEARLSLRAR
ncbi:MAG: hypothetical protein WB586_22285 [Chthoniobacterales bacterium]